MTEHNDVGTALVFNCYQAWKHCKSVELVRLPLTRLKESHANFLTIQLDKNVAMHWYDSRAGPAAAPVKPRYLLFAIEEPIQFRLSPQSQSIEISTICET